MKVTYIGKNDLKVSENHTAVLEQIIPTKPGMKGEPIFGPVS